MQNQLLFYNQLKTIQLFNANYGRFCFREKIFVKVTVHRGSTQWKLFKLWSIYSLSDQATISPSNSLISVSLLLTGNRFVPQVLNLLSLLFPFFYEKNKWKLFSVKTCSTGWNPQNCRAPSNSYLSTMVTYFCPGRHYFNLSTTLTSPQRQQPLTLVPSAKIASRQRPVNQRLTNSV